MRFEVVAVVLLRLMVCDNVVGRVDSKYLFSLDCLMLKTRVFGCVVSLT